MLQIITILLDITDDEESISIIQENKAYIQNMSNDALNLKIKKTKQQCKGVKPLMKTILKTLK